jgi:dihydrofolate synthase/folylpolyglutamate synthase
MNYRETLADIFSRGRFGVRPGLERIAGMLDSLGNPQAKLRIIQIAGTNGKGSTGAFLSAVLTAAGVKTAFFSSPHLVNFTERFRLDGVEMAEATLAGYMERVMSIIPPEATFFEIVTAIGFLGFCEEGADVAIMEAGMGGEWDATNVAQSILSIIAPISFDHCEYLGDTLPAIAAEKAGIIKPGRPVVIARQEPEVLAILLEKAAELDATPVVWGDDYTARWVSDELCFSGLGKDLFCRPALKGRFQAGNAAAAIAAARVLARQVNTINDAVIARGLASASWPGRMEFFPGSPSLLLDGAHNPAGAAALAESLAEFRFSRLLLVVGIMADKAWQEVLTPLLSHASMVCAVSPALDRALPAQELVNFCSRHKVKAVAGGNVKTGLEMAKALAAPDDMILVCGSLFTVGEARAIITGGDFMPIRG